MATHEASQTASTDGPRRPVGRIGRIPIRLLTPRQPEDRWPPKAFSGEVVPFAATVFREGHGLLGVELELTRPDGATTRHPMRMRVPGTDRWTTEVLLETEGRWRYRVRAWSDDWASWLHAARIKIDEGQDLELVFAAGAGLLDRDRRSRAAQDAAAVLRDTSRSPAERLAAATGAALVRRLREHPIASLTTVSESVDLQVERQRSGVGAWYEFFPRSEGAARRKDGSWQSGTLRTAAKRLPAIAAMGFDVVYLPPIHPIGHSYRKGPNNTLTAGPNDPGSPWAIGSAAGGHDAVHPDLGTLADFSAFVAAARRNGIEVALDLALQCSPDHPWVSEHPEWFTTRPDGSIAYAENPPKKYQDIFPLNFDNDPEGLRAEVLRILRHWMSLGVRIFRVDNPHTKPLDFWEWLLAEIAAEDPDVVFLAEAFTRPPLLHALAGAGFQQSYTYFTWRNTKRELEDYLVELSQDTADFLRPNLFVNTPDILTEYLQFGGPAAYKVRASIAATAAPTWGVYSGFELMENVARPGSEENIDNEKYEYRPRDWAGAEARGESLAGHIARLNRIRSEHPALRQLRNLRVHWSDDDHVLVYSKHLSGQFTRSGQDDTIIVVANVDPHSVRETIVHLDVTELGLPLGSRFAVRDLLSGDRWDWGADNFVRLDAFASPVHILSVEHRKGR